MFESSFDFDKAADLSSDDRSTLVAAVERERTRRLRESASREAELVQLQHDYQAELEKLIGSRNYRRYRRLHARRVRSMRDARRNNPKNARALKRIENRRRRRIQDAENLVRRVGIEPAMISELRGKYSALVRDIVCPKVSAVVMQGDAPRETRNWIRFQPPYFGSYRDTNSGGSTGTQDFHTTADARLGLIALDSYVVVADTSDYDWGGVEHWVDFAVLLQSHRDFNTVHVIPHFRVGESFNQLHARDECGWSHYSILQVLNPVVEIVRIATGESLGRRWLPIEGYEPLELHSDDPGSWHWQYWMPGESVSPLGVNVRGPYSEGEWLCLWFGLRAFNHVVANDFTITSGMTNYHQMTRVSVLFSR